ncbi:MAG: YbhB/YbcL family Raf kinase inhibitor-like protein [Patescibacteria group bacterium]
MLTLGSPAFEENGNIPALYTCDGTGINPALSISGVSSKAKSLVLIVDDPDIPEFVKESMGISVFDHWVVFNIPPTVTTFAAGAVPPGIEGNNTRGVAAYRGPCPPDREHRYFFKLFALDTLLELSVGASRTEIEHAMEGHVLESAELIGRYDRKK